MKKTSKQITKKPLVKRFDTKISTIEEVYNIDLGVKSNMKLGNYLVQKGYPSLSKMLQN